VKIALFASFAAFWQRGAQTAALAVKTAISIVITSMSTVLSVSIQPVCRAGVSRISLNAWTNVRGGGVGDYVVETVGDDRIKEILDGDHCDRFLLM
jgi:hypothetical protein